VSHRSSHAQLYYQNDARLDR